MEHRHKGVTVLPHREALEERERRQLQEYECDCANVSILQTLEKESRTPGERVRWNKLPRSKLRGITPAENETFNRPTALL